MLRSLRSIRVLVARAALAAIGVVCASRASATGPDVEPLDVVVRLPDACPARPTLLDRVRSHTPRVRAAAAGENARSLRVDVSPSGDHFVADLKLVDEGEVLERRVPGKSCEEVIAAVALITALMIDPLASTIPTDAGAVVDDARPPPPPPAPAPRAKAPELDAAPRPAPRRLRASAGVSVEAYGLGGLVVGRGVWLEGAVRSRATPALRLRLSRTQSFTEEREHRPAFFRLTTAGLDGCLTVLRTKDELPGTLELRPCAAVAAGVLEGTSAAFGPLNRMPRPWLALGVLVQARWRLFGPLELEASGGVTLPLVRDNFFFLPRDDVYRAPGAALLGNVGVGTTFW